jgi:hypothetical protein
MNAIMVGLPFTHPSLRVASNVEMFKRVITQCSAAPLASAP